jgi:hypothetical protein
MFSGFWQLGFGGEQEKYQIRVLRDSTEIEFTGLIGFGATKDVERQLSLYPTVTIIHLNSRGGRVAEARKLGRLISERGLTTTSSRECRSACTIAYAAGERRVMAKNAVFGFHRPSFPGVDELELSQEYATDKAYLLSRGIEASFIERIYATPSTEMWTPSEEELMASGFVTEFAGTDEVGLSGILLSDLDKADRELSKVPAIAVLKKYEPDVYGRFRDAFVDGFQRGRSLAELRAETMPLMVEVYTRRMPNASDEALLAAIGLFVEQGRIIERKGSRQCLKLYGMPEGGGRVADINPLIEFPQEMQQRELQVMSEVISSAAESPVVPVTLDSVGSELEAAISLLVAKVGDDARFLNETAQTEEEMAIKCNVVITMFEVILDQPPREAAVLLRAMVNEA